MARNREHTSDYGGFVLAFEPRRTEKIAERLFEGDQASESFSAMDWEFFDREIVFLALTPERAGISGAALMERMHGSGGTGKLKMRIYDPVLFETSVDPSEIRELGQIFDTISTAEHPRRIDSTVWRNLVRRLQQIRPEDAEALEDLDRKRQAEPPLVGQDARLQRLAEQRDAIGLALEVAGMDRNSALGAGQTESIAGAKSVLDILSAEPFHEQDIMRHDERIFGKIGVRSCIDTSLL